MLHSLRYSLLHLSSMFCGKFVCLDKEHFGSKRTFLHLLSPLRIHALIYIFPKVTQVKDYLLRGKRDNMTLFAINLHCVFFALLLALTFDSTNWTVLLSALSPPGIALLVRLAEPVAMCH